jgi:hypothetical protein
VDGGVSANEMTPVILAEHMGWSRVRAWREMVRIEAAYPGVVERRGAHRTPVAEARVLAMHIRGMRETPAEREVRLLRVRLAELEQRVDAESQARIQFQSMAHEWFMRVSTQKNVSQRKAKE